ncbi:vesicle-associated membrane protein 7-like isoform X3 [Convolutriloba macropyga]|uniref:vesicle-associated membrane protein 7-like isoform X3 n=1 Tax=Convolutriloba macropyga TaxID=536237 RepID=UPI003F52122F
MLYYSALGYESVILADCTVGTEGSLMSVASQHLLSVISRQSTIGVLKDSRVYGEYRLHCLIKDSIVAITITDSAYSVEQSYKFLEDVHKRFNASESLVARSQTASELQLNYEFRPVLKQLMTQYSKSSGKISGVNAKVEEVKQVMLDNIDKAIERGDRLESLEERTTQLSHELIVTSKSGFTD